MSRERQNDRVRRHREEPQWIGSSPYRVPQPKYPEPIAMTVEKVPKEKRESSRRHSKDPEYPVANGKAAYPALPTKREPEEEEEEKPSAVEDLFLKTDLHGLPDWYQASTMFTKIVWSIILLVSLSILGLEIYKAANDFQENPILTTFGLVAEPSGMKFPEVYLCPSNPIHYGNKKSLTVNEDWEQKYAKGIFKAATEETGLDGLLAQKATVWQSLSSVFDEHISPPAVSAADMKPWVPKDIDEYYKTVGYPLNTFLQQCAFNNIAMPCEKLATPIFDGEYGKCFLIRLDNTSFDKQIIAGVGLSLVLNLDFENALPEGESDDSPLYDGVVMKVADKLDVGSQQLTLIAPGTFTRVGLEATKFQLIPRNRVKAGQKCIKKEQEAEKLRVLKAPYTLGTCQSDCVRYEVLQNCSCHMAVDKVFLKNQSYPFCTPEEMTKCVYPTIFEEYKAIQKCNRGCYMPCDFWQFRTDASHTSFPSAKLRSDWQPPKLGLRPRFGPAKAGPVEPNRESTLAPMLSEDITILLFPTNKKESDEADVLGLDNNEASTTISPVLNNPPTRKKREAEEEEDVAEAWTKGSVILLDVAFSTLNYVEITQENSMTFTSFVGVIGGHVGLWAGASMITAIKLFVISLPLLWAVCLKCCWQTVEEE